MENDEKPLIVVDDAVDHIRWTLEDLFQYYGSGGDRPEHVIQDFIDNVHVLSALLKTLEFTTLRQEFLEHVAKI